MGDFKKKTGKTRLGSWIKKASKIFPDLLEAGVMLGTGNVLGAVEAITGKLKSHSGNESPELKAEAQRLLYEFETNKNEFTLEAFKAEVDDRKDARVLYSKDSLIQKIFAIVFLFGYGLLSWYLLTILISQSDMPQLAETMVTMIWTGTSMKLNTIIDFLFGGSIKT